MWKKMDLPKGEEEWFWPLHPTRQEDHLRVWKAGTNKEKPWMGALVLDGNYFAHIECVSAEDAKTETLKRAKAYLTMINSSISLSD